ncbi:MAG TPA: AbrB/MazE/SpoVT family DNA-binding domain-containing protein [Thermohalobaculum sp.]|nr:AbrB/MazE/SpoVT family DNA-binding domain-containing protein [Thermohalobaculum sp.]
MASTYHEIAPRDPHSKTGRVWKLAEDITRAKGRRATRSEVIDAYVAEGGEPGTASTQFWHWKKAYEAELQRQNAGGETRARPNRSVGPARLKIGQDGRVVIPSEMRAAMQLGPDGTVIARVVGGELQLVTLPVAVRRAQEFVRGRVPEGVSLADELIAERRAEARREDAE